MKHTTFIIFLFFFSPFCRSPLSEASGYVEFKFIGLVFNNYIIDSLDSVNEAKQPGIFILVYIANKSSDTLNLQAIITTEFNYIQPPLKEPKNIPFFCQKLCSPMPPKSEGYQEFLNDNYSFWIESGHLSAYNDSVAYKNRLIGMYANSSVTISFKNNEFKYLIKENDIICENDYNIHLFNRSSYKQWRSKLHGNSRFPIERVYQK